MGPRPREVIRALPPVRRLIGDRDAARAEAAELRHEVEKLRTQLAAVRDAPTTGEYPPGHFHSPIPDMDDVWAREATIWAPRSEVPGIDLRPDAQIALMGELADLAAEHPWTDGHTLRYRFDNHMFAKGDALALYGMLRLHRPPRVVEVGSGFSSALMLDTDDTHFGGTTRFTFIDPHPERLHSLLSDDDRTRATVIEERAELLDPEVFSTLSAGDLLFIDSSHVSRIGSDVNHLFLEVLPNLPAGVLVHIHDIPWPFEYWKHWVAQGRYWNEAYLLRGLLTDNPRFRVLWFSAYMMREHRELVDQRWPEFGAHTGNGASIWLQTA
jgi:Methyltransferase domain